MSCRGPSVVVGGMRMVIVSVVAVALLGVFVMVMPPSGSDSEEAPEEVPETLADFGSVGAFEFVNQDGDRFSSEELEGKVWLASFVFTSCAAECPILTRKLVEVREQLGASSETAYVSFSVDPQTDTPSRLREYASEYGSAERWDLLTGDPQELDTFITSRFLLPTAADNRERTFITSTSFLHSDKLLVVDRTGAIRYHTDGMKAGAVERLTEAMRRLL